MALDPNGALAEYFYELGAIAYLIDPAGTNSLPTTDPAGTTSPASASAPTPTYIPVTGANSVAAEVVDSSAAYSAAVASPPTTDPASTYSPAVPSAPSADAASTYSAASASAPTIDPASTYSAASASALMIDPAGAYSPAGPGAPSADPARALVAAAAHIPVTGATSAASEIVSPPGTYLPSGASAPIADPGGTFSGTGASAPTIDPAGTYSSNYALDRLFVEINSIVQVGQVVSFGSATDVANYFGASSSEAALAKKFFSGYAGAPAQMLFTNYPYAGEPAQLLGGDVTSLTQVQSIINGSLSLNVHGVTYTANVNLSGVQSFSDAAAAIRNAFNTNLPVEAKTSGDSITPVSVSFTGTINGGYLEVTSVSKGSIELGAMISGTGFSGAQIVTQLNGTPGGVGLYALLGGQGVVSSGAMTESYGLLTVGTVLSGQIAVGEQIVDKGVIAPLTAIESSASIARGPGSQWIVDLAQTVSNATAGIVAPPLSVQYQAITGATASRGYFDISANGAFGYDNNPSTVSYATGSAAGLLGLMQGEATLSNPGGQTTNAAQFMTDLVQNPAYNQFGSFQVSQLPALLAQYDPTYLGDLANWAQSTAGQYPDLTQYTTTTPPAGSSAPTIDPAGTYSGPDASAPTPADPGTYIPMPGQTSVAAEIPDLPGYYSPAGASAPTIDPAGTYSGAQAGAPTPADPGTYIPVTGATSIAAEKTDSAGTYSAAGASAPTTDPAGTYSGADASAPTVEPGGWYSAAGASAPTMDPAGTYSSPYALNRLFLTWKNTTPDNAILSFNSATAVANYYGASSNEAAEAKVFFAGYGGTSATMMFTRIGIGRRPHLIGANVSDLTLNQLQSIHGSLNITLQGWTYSSQINLSGVNGFKEAAAEIQTALDMTLPTAAVTTGDSITPETVSFTGTINHASLQVTSVSSGTLRIGAQISGPGIKPGSEIISQASGKPGGAGTYILFSSSGTVASEQMTASDGLLTVGEVTSGAVAIGEQVTDGGLLPTNTAILGNVSGGTGPGSTWVVNKTPSQPVTGANLTMTGPPLTVFLDWVNRPIVGATENNDFFSVSVDGQYNYNENPSTLSYMSGTAAAALGLTQASGAIDTSPGGQHPSVSDFMTNLVQNETNQFGSFQTTSHAGGMAEWAQSNPDFSYLGDISTTPSAGSSLPITDPAGTWSGPGATAPTLADPGTYIPGTGATSKAAEIQDSAGYYSLAGASAPTIDPAGTWSGPGASAPTLAAAGTYIPVTGATSAAAEIEDTPGTYSLAGASAPTFAQVGYYVPTAGASSEKPDDPGYYTPNPGATAEILALKPTISGTVAGQSVVSGQTGTPFSKVKIDDPNILTSEGLTIQITGGGGKLSDGAGFDGLTKSASGVYTLSGNAGAVTKELDALVFAPNTYSSTTTFTLTDTTSVGTSAIDANTTVIVTNGEPLAVSVSTFLADKSTLDKMPGGFDILDLAAAITTDLDQLSDPNIDAITISDNAEVSPDVQQLTTDATAIGKLHNANLSPALLAISDTATDVEAGLSTLVADTGEISSITASNGPVVVTAATFLADQTTLDKIVGGVDATLDGNLTYGGSFSGGAGDTFVLSGGSLLLNGADTFSGGTVDGSALLETQGTTTVSGLTIGGTVEWENTNIANESGGSATIGDSSGDQAFLYNTSTGIYDILDDSGIGVGASPLSYIKNAGLIEKTGGTATSAIAPVVSNNGTLEVSAGTLDFQAGILSGTGSDIVSGAATLEFDANVVAGQTASFAGGGGTLDLTAPTKFAGVIGEFDTPGGGWNSTIEVAGPWVFTGFTENAGGTDGTLGFAKGASTTSLTLLGNYNPVHFVAQSGPSGSTLITYA
jgi:hypothetical protein